MLAKMAFDQEHVPASIFANAQHKPSIRVDKVGQNGAELAPLDSRASPSPDQPCCAVMEVDEGVGSRSRTTPD